MRAFIAEDEPVARRRLRRLLGEAGVEVVGEAPDGEAAVRMLNATTCDVVFLDIRMPGLDGFEVIREIGVEAMPPVVFVTAHESYALRAFEVHAVDYLLKPFDKARLASALERLDMTEVEASERRAAVQRLVAATDDAGEGAASGAHGGLSAERLLVKDGDAVRFLKVADVDWLEAEGNYVNIHVGDKTHLVRRKIGELEQQLDDRRFLRIHRSTIVNVDSVDCLVPWFSGGYMVRLHTGEELKLSRNYAARLFERIGSTL